MTDSECIAVLERGTPTRIWIELDYIPPTCPTSIVKKPAQGGLLDAAGLAWIDLWWRRRESNPRPQALYRQFYILSTII
jgi:hypothetical protein